MKIKIGAASLVLTVFFSGNVFAVSGGKTLEFKGSPTGTVTFDGSVHKNAGLVCADCHNPEMFPKMKRGTIKITMSDLYAGKYCGKCHDGKKAFLVKENCTRCHHKSADK